MTRHTFWVALATASAALAAATGPVLADPPGLKTLAVGARAPDFSLPSLRSGQPTVSLAAFRGRPVVVNFWASWCEPCKEELPVFEAAHRRLGDRVAFVGVDRLDARDDGVGMADRYRLTYALAYDREGSLDGPFRLRGTPTTVFISPTGRIVDHVTGQLSAARLNQGLERLTGGQG